MKSLMLAALMFVLGVGINHRYVAPVVITFPVTSGDTNDHRDLLVGQVDTLRIADGRSARWTSGNPSVVSVGVSSGILRARARGYGTITATVDGVSAKLRVCATEVPRDSIPASVVGMTAGPTLPAPGAGVQMLAHLQLRASPDWGPCVHWAVVPEDTAFAWIDRQGVLHTTQTARFVATIGPRVP